MLVMLGVCGCVVIVVARCCLLLFVVVVAVVLLLHGHPFNSLPVGLLLYRHVFLSASPSWYSEVSRVDSKVKAVKQAAKRGNRWTEP